MAMRAKKVQPAKTEAIESAKKTFEGYNDFIFTDYRGLTVEQISALRGKLREKDSQFKVVKNNFANSGEKGHLVRALFITPRALSSLPKP